jgi:hypothetical protein
VRVREGGVRIRVGGRRVIRVGGMGVRGVVIRIRKDEARDGRIGVVDWGNGVPDTPSGLSSGVQCLNVTRLA